MDFLLFIAERIAKDNANAGLGVDFDDVKEDARGFVVINRFPGFAAIGCFDDDGAIADTHGYGVELVYRPNVAKVFVGKMCV